ncbi:MAG: Glu/Leu/Phe/Val dehydrogenase dimerization domain-containing protein [Christensenella sp.]|nr:Glu/Leu/Phe/Val dehydrogenase dimerization domain-containing protein [Christensenella sp.]
MLDKMQGYGHEEVVFARDESTGLQTIVAIHSTVLGPAVGGTRFWNYDTEEAAIYDVLRLSRGMTLKNAAAGLKLGGGKAVIIGDPKKLKSQEFFHAYGRIINSLGGRYYTAEDVNISAQDIAYTNEVTPYVTGRPEISGNPSPYTARGVYMGIRAGAKEKFGSESLSGKVIAVQGLGSVGYALCELLAKDGAFLKVTDINKEAVAKAVAELGAQEVTDDIIATDCDIFAPCALGAILNTENVAKLRCAMVSGCANNVLADAETGEALEACDILYLPDYIVNAGGIISCSEEVANASFDKEVVTRKVDGIYDTTRKVIALAKEKGITTYLAADEYAMSIIEAEK